MAQSLYHYTNDFLEVKAALEAAGVDEEVFHDTLEAYEDNIAAKMENVIKYHDELVAIAAAQHAESKRFDKAAKANQAKADKLKEYVDQTMKAIGATEIQAGAYKLNYRKGSEVVEVDETKLPSAYWVKQPDKPMGKPELKKLLKEGKEIEGVCLKRNPDTLQIRL